VRLCCPRDADAEISGRQRSRAHPGPETDADRPRRIGKTVSAGRIAALDDELDPTLVTSALARNAGNLFQEIINLSPSLPDELKVAVVNIEDPSKLADVIAANLNVPLQEKQRLLEATSIKTRLTLLTNLLNREVEVLHSARKSRARLTRRSAGASASTSSASNSRRSRRNSAKPVEGSEVGELRDKIDKAKMPPEVKKVAIKEADRLATITPAAAEYAVARTYLDWLIGLPWSKSTDDKLDIGRPGAFSTKTIRSRKRQETHS